MPEHNDDLTWERDVEKAKALLDEAGFDYSIPIHIFCNYSGQEHVDFLDLCVQNAAEAGVTVEYLVDSNWTEHLAYTNYDLRYAGGMSNILTDLLAYNGRNFATAAPAPNGSNFQVDNEELAQYIIERYDEVIDNYKAALTPEEQQERAERRAAYLKAFRAQMRGQLDNTVVEYPDGSRVSLREAAKKK